MSKRRSGEAQAAQRRTSAGPMKHRLEPRAGARNEHAELLEEYMDELVTAETITDEQIRELRMTFVNVADWRMVSTCTMALWAPLSSSDRMFLMEPYHSQALKAEQMRKEARARCAEILNTRAAGKEAK